MTDKPSYMLQSTWGPTQFELLEGSRAMSRPRKSAPDYVAPEDGEPSFICDGCEREFSLAEREGGRCLGVAAPDDRERARMKQARKTVRRRTLSREDEGIARTPGWSVRNLSPSSDGWGERTTSCDRRPGAGPPASANARDPLRVLRRRGARAAPSASTWRRRFWRTFLIGAHREAFPPSANALTKMSMARFWKCLNGLSVRTDEGVMNLSVLEPQFLKITSPGHFLRVDTIQEADGVIFLCPVCFKSNNGRVGTHSVICWQPHVPRVSPYSGRWRFEGTGYGDLSLVAGSSSILLTGPGCGAHFFIRDGKIV